MKGAMLIVSFGVLFFCIFLVIVLTSRWSLGITGQCWKEVVDPFGFSFKPDSNLELHLNPVCLEKVVITSSVSRCKHECGKFEDCSSKCIRGETGKTFFVLVRKNEGVWGTIKRAATNPLETLKESFEENMVFSLPCDMYDEDIEYVTGDEPECTKLRILKEENGCSISRIGKC